MLNDEDDLINSLSDDELKIYLEALVKDVEQEENNKERKDNKND